MRVLSSCKDFGDVFAEDMVVGQDQTVLAPDDACPGPKTFALHDDQTIKDLIDHVWESAVK